MRQNWVAWLFSARLTDASRPAGSVDWGRVGAVQHTAMQDLLKDQIAYHRARRRQSHRAGRCLVVAGEIMFLIVVALVFVKLWLLWDGGAEDYQAGMIALELGVGILPAWAAASVGIRAYAEMEMLAEQSHTMLKALRDAQRQITQLDPAAPLASQALGSALSSVATLMLEDLEGWAKLFRAKVPEA